MKNKIIHRFALAVAIPFFLNACSPSTGNSQDKKTSSPPTLSDEPMEWELAWADEFEYKGHPDPNKWGYEVGYIRNDEEQYYTEQRLENARVENGQLIIEARNDNYKNHPYTSASLITRDKAEWKYGRIEVRAKLPTGRGMWPAIWMLGTNIDEVGWPACGEIDIMENVGFDPNIIHANIHTEAYNHTLGTNKGNGMQVHQPYEKFVTYSVEWLPNRITFFIGDEAYFSFSNESDDPAVWPFDQKFYLIINAAVGGSWGGQQGIDDGIFPQQYLVDYVRAYKQK